MDQIESSTPVFIDQLKGIPANQRYYAATIFTDDYSDILFLHLHNSLTSQDKFQYKMVFETYSQTLGVNINNYHSDNGRFQDNEFMQLVKD